MFSTGANGLGFSTGGVQRMDIGSVGDLNLPAVSTETKQVNIGNGRSGDGTSLIDFIGDTTYPSYGLRMIRNAGENGNSQIAHRGTGNLQLLTQDAGFIIFSTDSTTRMTIGSGGAVTIVGSLSKGSGSFRIPHPIREGHDLVHSFVEGPQADNIYRGVVSLVDGKATVNLDEAARMTEGTFVALNTNTQCFTTNEDDWTAIRGKVNGNLLTIEAQDPSCTASISWLVIGERHDQHMLDTHWTDENGRVITEPLTEVPDDATEE